MQDTLENFVGGARCGGITNNNFCFADDIDLIIITVKLDETSRKYGMEISTEKSKVMVTGKTFQNQLSCELMGSS